MSSFPRRLWVEFRRQPVIWASGALVVIACLLSSFSALGSARTADVLQREIRHREAADCVADWKRADGARESIALATTGTIRALVSAFPQANPAIVSMVEDNAAVAIHAAQDEIPDPPCDREAAQRRLDE
jgi:hypothetical protein